MKRCKCLKEVGSNGNLNLEFQQGRLYKYEFQPSPGLGQPFFRVFNDDGKSHNFAFKSFLEYFEK